MEYTAMEQYWIWLSSIPGLGAGAFDRLLSEYGKAQYANSGIPAGPAQPAYSEIPAAPAEKAANTEETRKAPVASIIFLFIATSLLFFRYLILFPDGNTSATNILFVMLAI